MPHNWEFIFPGGRYLGGSALRGNTGQYQYGGKWQQHMHHVSCSYIHALAFYHPQSCSRQHKRNHWCSGYQYRECQVSPLLPAFPSFSSIFLTPEWSSMEVTKKMEHKYKVLSLAILLEGSQRNSPRCRQVGHHVAVALPRHFSTFIFSSQGHVTAHHLHWAVSHASSVSALTVSETPKSTDFSP